jgi:glyoxylase I family protein
LLEWADWLDSQGVQRSALRDVLDFGAMFNFVDPDGVQIEFIFVEQSESSTGRQ